MKNYLFICCCFFLNTIYAQTDTGTLQGETYYKSTGTPFVNIHIKGIGLDTMVSTDHDGKYELQLKVGQYQIKTLYPGYDGTEATINIKPDEVYKHISDLQQQEDFLTPFKIPAEAINRLYGIWTIVCTTMDGKKKRLRKRMQPTISFGKLKKHQHGMGEISFHDGCKSIGSYWFRHTGNGAIKIESVAQRITAPPKCKQNLAFEKIIGKMSGEFEVQFIKNDELLIKNDAIEVQLKRYTVKVN